MRDSLWDSARWWIDILERKFRVIFPALKSQQFLPICLLVKNGFELSNTSGNEEGEVTPIDRLSEKLNEIAPFGNKTGALVSVLLDNGRYVIRELSKVKLPLSKQMAMAELDLAASTPFQSSDVYLLPLVTDEHYPGSAYAIVKKTVLDPLLNELRASKRRVGDVKLRDPYNVLHSIGQSGVNALQVNKPKRIARLRFITSALALLFLGTYAHAYFRNETAIARLEQQNDALSKDAKEVRTIIDRRTARVAELNGLRNQIAASTPVTVVWEELARALPDSSYLTDLSVKDKTVSIAGYSVSASSLIGVLEGSSLFEKAEFAGAVVKVPGYDGDRFSINLQLGEKQ